MDPITILTALTTIVPSVARWLGGKKAEDVAKKATKIVTSITGEKDPKKAIEALKANQEYQLKFQQAWQHFEIGIQEELTKRHQADMASDSWLSKNVRPLCLLLLTLAITVGIYLPPEYVDADKFKYLTDMSQWVYGYYFLGRSAFDKGAIRFRKER